MTSLPNRSLTLTRYLPINYNQNYYQTTDGQQDGGGGMLGVGGPVAESGTVTPRRSLSQTILSQMSSPTTGFGLNRSTSPSPLLSSALRRTPSLNRGNFMSRGPSLQSLVKSFINRVSRGTQTDSDDNFDSISIASMKSGFSALDLQDLSQSRLKLFINDQQANHQNKSYASSHVDDNEFVEELQKLRDEINGEFGADGEQPEPIYTENQFDLDDLQNEEDDQPESVYEKKSYRQMEAVPVPKVITCDQSVETDLVQTQDGVTQTDQPVKVQLVDRAMETDPEIVPQIVQQVKEPVTLLEQSIQTDSEQQQQEIISEPTIEPTIEPAIESTIESTIEPAIAIESTIEPVKRSVETRTSETQTNLLKFCDHCAGVMLNSTLARPVQEPIVVQQPQPQIMHCEFVITHADIICKENKMIRARSESTTTNDSKASKFQSKLHSSQVNTRESVMVQTESPVESSKSNEILTNSSSDKSSDEIYHKTLNHSNNIDESPKEVVEEISQLKVTNLQSEFKPREINPPENVHLPISQSNGHHQQPQNGTTEPNELTIIPVVDDETNGAVQNGTLTLKGSKKKKKDKTEKKTPKKSPRKILMQIIPGSDDEERDKRHHLAMTSVRPKCCTIS